MQVSPDAQRFSEIYETGEEAAKAHAEAEQKFRELVDADPEQIIVAEGTKEQLERLQNDLRRVGYRKAPFKTTPLHP